MKNIGGDILNMIDLMCGNCLELMDNIKDKSVDLILCDPPYGTTPLEWDSVMPFNQMWKHYNRVIKENWCILLFSQEPFATYLRMSNIQNYKYDWYWVKERLTNVFQVKRRPGKVVENICVFYKNQPTYNPQKSKHIGRLVTNKIGNNASFSKTLVGIKSDVKPLEYVDDGTRYPTQVITINRDNTRKRVHPTQKPVEILQYLINTYTNDNDTVLDNCMGSGSTGVACVQTHRNFIGIELNKDYFEIAKHRIDDELSKIQKRSLF